MNSQTTVQASTMDECSSYSVSGQAHKKRCSGAVLRLLGASVCIIGAIVTWVAMAEKLQKLNESYKKPYFLSYWVHSSYALLYVLWRLWRSFPGDFRCNRVGGGAFPKSQRLVGLTAIVSVLLFACGYTWYFSLPRTNIPANTAIYQSGCVFIFVLSVVLLRERVTVVKVSSVLVAVAGVCLLVVFSSKSRCDSTPARNISLPTDGSDRLSHSGKGGADSCAERSTPVGYVLLLASVMLYAATEVLFKKYGTLKGDPAAVQNSVRFMGYMGIHTLLWQWFPLIALHYSGFETFEWPTLEIFGLMCLNAFLDLTFNTCILIANALASPLFVSVGTILAIPISVVVDLFVQDFLLPALGFVGMALIVIGFGGFTFSEFVAARMEGEEEGQHLQVSVSGEDGDDSSIKKTDEHTSLLDQGRKKSKRPLWKLLHQLYFL